MIRQNYGKIFNIASLKGVTGSPCQSNYATSKAAIIGFSKSLAKEVGKNNIVVNAICPGFVETDLNKGDQIKKENARRQSLLDYRHALDDYVNFMIYAISDRFQGISGQVFHLDSRI
jgi:3-oxoacyl-[acyl-carrier protein] reductase